MTGRLGHLVDQVTAVSGTGQLPFVALEHLAGGSGGLLPEAELAEVVAAPSGMVEFAAGDVLFGKLRPYLAKSWLANRSGLCSTELIVMRPRREAAESRWLGYLVQSRAFIDWAIATSEGVKMPRTAWEKLRLLEVAAPALGRQRAIADYLDAETARIDRLVTMRNRMRDLLELRLQILVRTLTDSGQAGFPFERIPLKRRWRVIDCKHRTPAYVSDGYPVVSPGDATAGSLDLSRCHRFIDAADYADLTEGERRPQRGDIIYTRNASIGIAAHVDTDDPFTMGQDVCLIRSEDQDQWFLTYVLNTFGVDQLEEQKIGSTFSRINVAQVLELLIPCPAVTVQRSIADRLDTAMADASRARAVLDRQIALLFERRQALITAAVTGQIEIPGVAA